MGKKGKASAGNLGKSLMKDRFGSLKNKRNVEHSMLHSAEINDGYDWGRLNLNSVTEENSFEEFLSTAQLAGTEFHAEKLNIKFVNTRVNNGLLPADEKRRLLEIQTEKEAFLKIPRRPKWDANTSPYELQEKEKEQFLEWRRSLAMLQETGGLTLTPYEKNLEFWRQLWRVVERSDILVQIVDARNPLLFRCKDLENYAKEIDPRKTNMILLNKADFLTDKQREAWAKYFSTMGIQIAFFSATTASQDQLSKTMVNDPASTESTNQSNSTIEYFNKKVETNDIPDSSKELEVILESKMDKDKGVDNAEEVEAEEHDLLDLKNSIEEISDNIFVKNSSKILSRKELTCLFRTVYKGDTYTRGVTTIGLVGYPNVGKSSTINALLMDKKVSVSATPGKTKHFQTLYLDKDLLLCDCPGLVMPSFVSTKAEMILNGVLPIDQMRDHVPPVTMLATLIPRHVIEDLYGIMIALPREGEDPDRPPTAEEILDAYAYNRGFMTQNGQPDNPRSSRYILKDFVNGKLLYCVAPPTTQQEIFHTFPTRRKHIPNLRNLPVGALRIYNSEQTTVELDKTFFQSTSSAVHVKGVSALYCPNGSNASSVAHSMQRNSSSEEKPWKKINKHANKKKREKSRRLYAHLDQH